MGNTVDPWTTQVFCFSSKHYSTIESAVGLIHGYKARDIKEPIYGGPTIKLGFPGGSVGKESTFQCRRWRFSPWVGKIPWGGHGNPLQYSCLRILWTEQPGGLQSMGSLPFKKESNTAEATEHTHCKAVFGFLAIQRSVPLTSGVVQESTVPLCSHHRWTPEM